MNSQAIVTTKSLQSIIAKIKDGSIKRIVTLTGAGVSVPSGIPDFRSPGGMYSSLRPELLTANEKQKRSMSAEPTLVVDWDLFRVNQFPYLEVRRPFILGTAKQQWKVTLAHCFVQLLHDKGLLQRHYTQNIDGLDHQLNIPAEKIVNVHGSLANAACEACGTEYPREEFCFEVKTKIKNIYDENDLEAPKESSNIRCKKCHKPAVKPATVLFGRNLPATFHKSAAEDFPNQIDLMIVMGTSLAVFPAAGLVNRVYMETPRLVLNLTMVGVDQGLDFGPFTYEEDDQVRNDAIVLGDSDQTVLHMVKELNWLQDLIPYQSYMCPNSISALNDALNELPSSV